MFLCSSWYAAQAIIKHTKSACLPIIESKSILDYNRKLLQALHDDLKWGLSLKKVWKNMLILA